MMLCFSSSFILDRHHPWAAKLIRPKCCLTNVNNFRPTQIKSSAIAEEPRDALSVEILSIAAQLYK